MCVRSAPNKSQNRAYPETEYIPEPSIFRNRIYLATKHIHQEWNWVQKKINSPRLRLNLKRRNNVEEFQFLKDFEVWEKVKS